MQTGAGSPAPKVVKLSWLLTAMGLLIAAAALCAYISLCLLFYQGQWQLPYRPDHTPGPDPSSVQLPFEVVPFAPGEAGVPQLTGWWIPAALPGAPSLDTKDAVPVSGTGSGSTILFLHDGHGSLSDALPTLQHLHTLGLPVFAIEYRDFGPRTATSPSEHPSEQRGIEDVRSALAYLTSVRHLAPSSIVLYGAGTGATWAAEAATPSLGKIVLEEVNAPASQILRADPRASFLPLSLLQADRLDARGALTRLSLPKLFLLNEKSAPSRPEQGADAQTLRLYAAASRPKQIATRADAAALQNFLRAVR